MCYICVFLSFEKPRAVSSVTKRVSVRCVVNSRLNTYMHTSSMAHAQEMYADYNHSTTPKQSESASTTLFEARRKRMLIAGETWAAERKAHTHSV